jgi:hypothetical protein
MDYLSSMYIDNEMDLDEKKQFVEKVRSDQAFYTQTLELLVQEQLVRKQPVLRDLASEQKMAPTGLGWPETLFQAPGIRHRRVHRRRADAFQRFSASGPAPVQQSVRPVRAYRRPGGTGRIVYRVAADCHGADRQQRILGGQPSGSFR